MEYLEFIFGSFTHWLGFTIDLAIVFATSFVCKEVTNHYTIKKEE